MKQIIFIVCCVSSQLLLNAQRNYTALVNPFIGTGGHGHTYPGASLPFGMMQLSPDTRLADWDGSSGYHYSDSVIYGFSHTHLSGTGIPDYCDLLLMPFTGETKWENQDYRSPFKHSNEKAAPGYYEVLLDKHQIKAQLTTTTRAGMHQYTFPQTGGHGKLMIDLTHRDPLLDVFIEKINDHELRGYRRSRSWARDQRLFFHIRSEQPFYTEVLEDSLNGKDVITKMVLSFLIPTDKTVRFKVGISGVDMEGAKKNLDQEIKDWNFEKLRLQAIRQWNKELSVIDVKGGSTDQQTVFYTALYHSFLSPNIYQDVDGRYRGTDQQIHKAEDFVNHSVFSLWDTYRAFHPLMTIINQERTRNWIKTFLKQYEQGGMLPVWELSANETFCMIGYHSVPVITDAWMKGIRGYDGKKALAAMRSYAESHRFGLGQYMEQGFISNDREHESVSKTLEYAYDDWCIAQFARSLGNDSVQKQYMQRAQFYKNVFDPTTGHMRGKIEGMWQVPFDPKEINNFFTEGNSWQYSFAVPQDIKTLMQMHGGKIAFAEKLNELFTTSSQTTGRDQADVTGLIGQYAHGNEPSHHMAYLFNYTGMPWRTQELVHRICKDFYTNTPDGLIGNEDCGQMSAWYIFSAIGFYPVNPANGIYEIGTPVFDEVVINLENGKKFEIRSARKTKASFYVQLASLNGKTHLKTFLQHEDIMKGGKLVLALSDNPSSVFGVDEGQLNIPVIDGELIVPVPYFDQYTNKFRSTHTVKLECIDKTATIYYRVVTPDARTLFVKYEKPFPINETCKLQAYAMKGTGMSRIVDQSFHRLPNNYTVNVLSGVHPMYTAGGPEALIDGIKGDVNWKTGNWQSYFDQDFEAVVDLQQEQEISSIGVHVLQDVSPWILYPSEVIFYASDDGKNFRELGRKKPGVPIELERVETMEILLPVKVNTRYLKIRAVSGGKLPAWHESAGNPSHLFIDEIIVK
ncbi:MAG: GH92 family glycosyl hydrolase [Flavisolibacter sp.]